MKYTQEQSTLMHENLVWILDWIDDNQRLGFQVVPCDIEALVREAVYKASGITPPDGHYRNGGDLRPERAGAKRNPRPS